MSTTAAFQRIAPGKKRQEKYGILHAPAVNAHSLPALLTIRGKYAIDWANPLRATGHPHTIGRPMGIGPGATNIPSTGEKRDGRWDWKGFESFAGQDAGKTQ